MDTLTVDMLPAHIAAKVVVHPVSGCWLYQGYTNRDGYAQARVNGKTRLLHRAAFEICTGQALTPQIELDHKRADRPIAPGPCLARNCICPEHVEPVDQATNKSRVVTRNSQVTHCPQGHAYAEHGFLRKCGRRGCRECERARKRKGAQC